VFSKTTVVKKASVWSRLLNSSASQATWRSLRKIAPVENARSAPLGDAPDEPEPLEELREEPGGRGDHAGPHLAASHRPDLNQQHA